MAAPNAVDQRAHVVSEYGHLLASARLNARAAPIVRAAAISSLVRYAETSTQTVADARDEIVAAYVRQQLAGSDRHD